MIVIRNTEFTLTQTVMARQRSSLILIVNLKAKYLPWKSGLTQIWDKLYTIESFQVPVSPTLQDWWIAQGDSPGTNPGTVWGIWWWHYAGPWMDHHANSEHQHKEVSPCKILCGGKGRCKDPDQPCHSKLAGPHEGAMHQQGSQM